jgi:hypothetical protein
MIKIICEKCGGEDLQFEGFGIWNTHEQDYDWEVTSAWCEHCKDIVPTTTTEV